MARTTLTQRVAALEAQLAAVVAHRPPVAPTLDATLSDPASRAVFTNTDPDNGLIGHWTEPALHATAATGPPPKSIAEISAELERSSKARERAVEELKGLHKIGVVHPQEARGEILAGADQPYLTRDMTFTRRPLDMPPFDSTVVWTRVSDDPGNAYHPQNTLAMVAESAAINSFQWPMTVYMTTTNHPQASADTSQNVAYYAIVHKRGSVWGAGFHVDGYMEESGTLIFYNGESYRLTAGGVVIGTNMQSDTPIPGDVAHLISGLWKRGMVRTDPGELLGIGDTPLWVGLDGGVQIIGAGDIGNFAMGLNHDTYFGPWVAPGKRSVHINSDGSVEINGPLRYKGKEVKT